MPQDLLFMAEWAQRFREAVRLKYGRTVSAATIARDLQVWSGGQFQVSNEAVRKWLIGRNMPRYSALVALGSRVNLRRKSLMSDTAVPAGGSGPGSWWALGVSLGQCCG